MDASFLQAKPTTIDNEIHSDTGSEVKIEVPGEGEEQDPERSRRQPDVQNARTPGKDSIRLRWLDGRGHLAERQGAGRDDPRQPRQTDRILRDQARFLEDQVAKEHKKMRQVSTDEEKRSAKKAPCQETNAGFPEEQIALQEQVEDICKGQRRSMSTGAPAKEKNRGTTDSKSKARASTDKTDTTEEETEEEAPSPCQGTRKASTRAETNAAKANTKVKKKTSKRRSKTVPSS